MRLALAVAIALALLAGCGPGGGDVGSSSRSLDAATRIDRCVQRLLQNASPDHARDERVHAYARTTYCERFETRGWIYDDGALAVAAHEWHADGMSECRTSGPGGRDRTVPCEKLGLPAPDRLECALLRHVRRSEVRAYLERMRAAETGVACDDGTPLDRLGVP